MTKFGLVYAHFTSAMTVNLYRERVSPIKQFKAADVASKALNEEELLQIAD
jgi:hypothetical protein